VVVAVLVLTKVVLVVLVVAVVLLETVVTQPMFQVALDQAELGEKVAMVDVGKGPLVVLVHGVS
jgi:aromatic ring-cleaving dioxygenase